VDCPNEADLLDYLRATGRSPAVTQHVAACGSCEQLLVAFAELSASRGPLAEGSGPPAGEVSLPAAGEEIGRYRVDAVLGRGAMGIVYLAHDPTLDRRVALKLLLEQQRSSLEEARVFVEARAAARVQHAHLVAVYDVGAWNGRVAIAMEYVDGPTLTRWLGDAPRATDAIAGVFVDVARGLAAAHDAGLVHCDVKPDNVLIGPGGAKLGDFGLAIGPDHAGAAGLRGTPKYMAPELLRGAPPSAASDQYALCVSLREAFTREPSASSPLSPASPASAASPTVPAGAVVPRTREVARPVAMPRWLHRVVARGCDPDPAQRFPSVAALSTALERGRHRRGKQLAVAGGVIVAVAAATGVALAARSPAADPCPSPRAELAQAWDAGRGQALAPVLGADAPRAVSRLDAYGNAWLAAGVAACRATRVEHRYSDVVLDQRTQCLDRARSRLRILVGELTAPATDSKLTADLAFAAIDTLPDLAGCDDVAALAAHTPPASPAERTALAAALSQLDRAIELVDLRRPDAALAQLRTSEAAIRAVPAGPSASLASADAQYTTGGARAPLDRRDEAGAAFERAYEGARAAANEHLEVKVAVELASALFREPATRSTAATWLGRARAVAERLDDDLLTALIAEREAALAFASNDYAAAVRGFRTAVDIRHRHYGDNDQRTALTRSSLASALGKTGAFDDARAEVHAAMSGLIAARGDSHPSLVTMWNALGSIELGAGDLHAARDALVEAGRRAALAYGPTHTTVIAIDINLATIARRLGDLDAARDAYQRASDALDKAGRHTSSTARAARQGLAQVALDRKDFATGRALIEALIAERLADPSPEPAVLASLRIDLATALTGERKYAEAETTLASARTAYVAAYGEHHPKTARVDLDRAANAMTAGDNTRAERLATPLAEDTKLPPDVRADAAWMVVNLIAKRQPARAKQLATTAAELAKTAGDTKLADEITRWLHHGG
jgi:tetratricopeptide (TPR) repeat protein